MKKVLSGIQPSGNLTLGNYLGAIKNYIKLQENFDCNFFIADLHSITVDQDPIELKKNINSLAAIYLACGLDKSSMFVQSDINEHAALGWIMQCISTNGELSRMTQFKDKSSKNESFATGLYTYPTLMAADILLYNADFVPVGDDQTQHLELSRNLARRFNNKYGETFIVPKPIISSTGARIMSLQNPEFKMSKSDENTNATIYILDDAKTILKKVKSAVTDSENVVKYDRANKPGISNLIDIYAAIKDQSIEISEKQLSSLQYGELKIVVANTIIEELEPIREKYNDILNTPVVSDHLNRGRIKLSQTASVTYTDVKKKMGLGI